ncbi:MAG: adenine phosphoribosyltransferase, partial [Euryarchaeota archaeon]|nr:adenine phosphoribosyltransferase [Euryarchaeota archaeon]
MRDIFLEQLSGAVRTIPNFPIDGVLFRDITPILTDHKMLTQT